MKFLKSNPLETLFVSGCALMTGGVFAFSKPASAIFLGLLFVITTLAVAKKAS